VSNKFYRLNFKIKPTITVRKAPMYQHKSLIRVIVLCVYNYALLRAISALLIKIVENGKNSVMI